MKRLVFLAEQHTDVLISFRGRRLPRWLEKVVMALVVRPILWLNCRYRRMFPSDDQ